MRAWTAKTLESAGERVADVQGDDNDDEEVDESTARQAAAAGASSAKTGAAEASSSTSVPLSPDASETRRTQ